MIQILFSYYFSSNELIKEKFIEEIENDENLCITVINVYEILKEFKWKNNKNKEEQFKEFLKDILVFRIDDDIINVASDIYSDLRKNGITIGDADILFAAIVIKNKGVLKTNKIRHYGKY